MLPAYTSTRYATIHLNDVRMQLTSGPTRQVPRHDEYVHYRTEAQGSFTAQWLSERCLNYPCSSSYVSFEAPQKWMLVILHRCEAMKSSAAAAAEPFCTPLASH